MGVVREARENGVPALPLAGYIARGRYETDSDRNSKEKAYTFWKKRLKGYVAEKAKRFLKANKSGSLKKDSQ